MPPFDRREIIACLAALGLVPAGPGLAQPNAPRPGLKLGPAKPFSYDILKEHARKLSETAYQAAEPPAKAIIQSVDFDKVQKIRFRPEDALWRGVTGGDPIAFFHLNKYSGDPVDIFALQAGADGKQTARQIVYSPDYFDYGNSGLDPKPLAKLGFAGFRVMESQTSPIDWLAFQGASYFRSSGQDEQYGASARGIAINTALQTAEEFPRFSQFWLQENGQTVIIHALLEGPSVTGAYKFECVKDMKQGGAVMMNAHCDLFFRADITRLGIAPLTSMYWYGENERGKAADWRPEIHDNDGLALWTGKGERIWRPLIDPPSLQTNFFMDVNPKGFGLMQRDRDFADYQDDGAFYNKRPGIWVEPKGNWGAGAVQLVEIPTDDETHDNIVVYWRPDKDVKAGDALSFDYRLYWQDAEPNYPKNLAKAVATRIGRGGIPGQPPPANKRKFVIDWQGGPLDQLQQRYDVTPVVSVSNGKADGAYVIKVVGTDRWRSLFDITLDGKSPIDLRCYLKLGDKTLTETWIYQYFP
ncbi:MAG TPA: glucan biosynthesis protein [Rhizomicrobium sp.]|nr:glucan biosynthesis protein [Rhizomicrobium sp.]